MNSASWVMRLWKRIWCPWLLLLVVVEGDHRAMTWKTNYIQFSRATVETIGKQFTTEKPSIRKVFGSNIKHRVLTGKHCHRVKCQDETLWLYVWLGSLHEGLRKNYVHNLRTHSDGQLPNALQGLPPLRGKMGFFFLSLKDSTELSQVAQCRNGLIYKRCVSIDFCLKG